MEVTIGRSYSNKKVIETLASILELSNWGNVVEYFIEDRPGEDVVFRFVDRHNKELRDKFLDLARFIPVKVRHCRHLDINDSSLKRFFKDDSPESPCVEWVSTFLITNTLLTVVSDKEQSPSFKYPMNVVPDNVVICYSDKSYLILDTDYINTTGQVERSINKIIDKQNE